MAWWRKHPAQAAAPVFMQRLPQKDLIACLGLKGSWSQGVGFRFWNFVRFEGSGLGCRILGFGVGGSSWWKNIWAQHRRRVPLQRDAIERASFFLKGIHGKFLRQAA